MRQDALVPVLKFCLRGMPIDLLLARLKVPTISADLAPDADGLMARRGPGVVVAPLLLWHRCCCGTVVVVAGASRIPTP